MAIGAVEPSLSPSMDIQVSSNFERLYFELDGRDGARGRRGLRRNSARPARLPASPAQWHETRALFAAHRVDDEETRATIAATWRATGELLDPHSAVAVAAAARGARDPADADGGARHRPSGQVPRRGRGRGRLAPPLPARLAA